MYYLNSAKKWWQGETQHENDLPLKYHSTQHNKDSNWHYVTQQVLKGTALLGVGVVGYLGLSTLFSSKKESEITDNEDKLNTLLEPTGLSTKLDVFNENANKFIPLSSLKTGRTLLSTLETKDGTKAIDDLEIGAQTQKRKSPQDSQLGMGSSRRALISKGGCEFQVNTYTTSSQAYPSVTSLVGGGFVVTWGNSGQDGDSGGIYGQRYNPTGETVGNEFQVNTYTTSLQRSSSVASLTDGGFVVTWASTNQGGSGEGIYGQRYNSTGGRVGNEFQTNILDASSPSVAGLANGGFVVTWQRQDGGGGLVPSGVYGQLYNSTGGKVSNEFQINIYTTDGQRTASVASLTDGGFVVTWTSDGQDGPGTLKIFGGSNTGAYGQRYNSQGGTVGPEFQINTYTTGVQAVPSVAGLTDGGFVVIWESGDIYGMTQDGNGIGIYGQRYDAAGGTIGLEFQVNSYTTLNQWYRSIASLTDGGFVITWGSGAFGGSGQDGDSVGIFGQRYNSTGGIVGPEFQINTYTTGSQNYPSVAGLTNGGFVVTWWGSGQNNVDGIFGRISAPCLINNTLTINENETVVLTTAMLGAIGGMGSPSSSSFNFTVTNIQHGYFDHLFNPDMTITSFTLQEIKNNQIRFTHDGNEIAPAYDVKVTDGEIETIYQTASITFFNANDRPKLLQNKLTIKQGESIPLDSNMLNATDVDNNNADLVFTLRNVRNGRFEKINNAGLPLFSFTLQQIRGGEMQFVHDGSNIAPSYEVKVGDGELETSYQFANITFTPNEPNPAPLLVAWFSVMATAGSTILTITTCAVIMIAKRYNQQSKKNNDDIYVELIEQELTSNNNIRKWLKMDNYFANLGGYSRIQDKDKLLQYEKAIKEYDKTVHVNPHDADLFYKRGLAQSHLGNYQEAIQDYDQAINLQPKCALFFYHLGKAKLALNNVKSMYKEIAHDFTKAIKLSIVTKEYTCYLMPSKQKAKAQTKRGVYLYRKTNVNKISAHIVHSELSSEPLKLSRLIEQEAAYHLNDILSTLTWPTDDASEVKLNKQLTEFILSNCKDTQKTSAEYYCALGIVHGKYGYYKKAIKTFDEAIKLDNKHIQALYSRGLANYNLGRCKEAIADYETALNINSRNAEVFYHLGLARLATGGFAEVQQAVKHFDRAFLLDQRYRKQHKLKIAQVMALTIVASMKNPWSNKKIWEEAKKQIIINLLKYLPKEDRININDGRKIFSLLNNLIRLLAESITSMSQSKIKGMVSNIQDKISKTIGEVIDLVTSTDPFTIPPEQIIICKDSSQREIKLGSGAFGDVYKGKWQNMDVAIKEAKYYGGGKLPEDIIEDIKQEAKIMASLTHDNIISFYGYCVNPYRLIIQYMPEGSLNNALYGKERLTWSQLLQIALGISHGIRYLHGKKILHRDLKPDNVLLDNLTVKLTDFGLAKIKKPITETAHAAGTAQYIAPELILGKPCTEKSDIYSFSIILWELAARMNPYSYIENQHSIPTKVANGLREYLPKNFPLAYTRLIKACWAGNPKERPSIKRISNDLELLKASHISSKTIVEAAGTAQQNNLTQLKEALIALAIYGKWTKGHMWTDFTHITIDLSATQLLLQAYRQEKITTKILGLEDGCVLALIGRTKKCELNLMCKNHKEIEASTKKPRVDIRENKNQIECRYIHQEDQEAWKKLNLKLEIINALKQLLLSKTGAINGYKEKTLTKYVDQIIKTATLGKEDSYLKPNQELKKNTIYLFQQCYSRKTYRYLLVDSNNQYFYGKLADLISSNDDFTNELPVRIPRIGITKLPNKKLRSKTYKTHYFKTCMYLSC